jgi:uncharacterized protein YqhQ
MLRWRIWSREEGKSQKSKKDSTVLPVARQWSWVLRWRFFCSSVAALITSWLRGYIPAVHNWVVFNLVDGLIRVIFFMTYIILISFLKDIRRVFQYHGAEHKVVHTWEAGEELLAENARRKSTLHPRCGTSFLLVVSCCITVFHIRLRLRAIFLAPGSSACCFRIIL